MPQGSGCGRGTRVWNGVGAMRWHERAGGMMDARRKASPASERATAAPHERVWVLDDPRPGTSAQAIGIAERLGVPFRRIPLAWRWATHVAGLVPGGSLAGLAAPSREAARQALRPASSRAGQRGTAAPGLVISAGRRSAAVALWMKQQYGCRIVHCMSPGVAGLLYRHLFDLLVIPEHDAPRPAPNVFPVLGAPHRLSPLLLRQAEQAWQERLGHLPHPRIALLVGGPVRGQDMAPALAHGLGRRVARLASSAGGSVLASTSRRTGKEATETLAAGLSPALHLLFRWGEPGENPYRGFVASADAIIVTADSVSMISEACATDAAVYVALPELAGPRHRRLIESLYQAGQARPLGNSLAPWSRLPLDEAGRVAAEIRRRFPLD
jgi:mitochondrial fission protein ELM1